MKRKGLESSTKNKSGAKVARVFLGIESQAKKENVSGVIKTSYRKLLAEM